VSRGARVCFDGHCVTCSDEGIPMRVVSNPEPGLAVCENDDGERQIVMTGIVDRAAPGDVLLVHAGTALLRLDGHVDDPTTSAETEAVDAALTRSRPEVRA
jgi:hydrogenase maturation factor